MGTLEERQMEEFSTTSFNGATHIWHGEQSERFKITHEQGFIHSAVHFL